MSRQHLNGDKPNELTHVNRRQTLRGLGLVVAGGAMTTGLGTTTARGGSSFNRKTWQSDAVPNTSIHKLSFPGTHHAAMVDPDPESPEYYDCQTQEVYTQLCDGIRFLDIRVESHGNAEDTNFYGHHSHKTGRSLDNEVFPQIEQYLSEVDSAGASELVLLKLSHFYDEGAFSDDEFEADDWRNLSDLLQTHFGDYAIDLGAMTSTDELLDTTLSEFDGPQIAIFYRKLKEHDDPLSLPDFTDRWVDWVDSYYPDTSTPGNVLAGGVTNEHTDTNTLGETQWIIRAPADLYTDGPTTNEMLSLYDEVVQTDATINPNIIRVDYYETSNVVELCRSFSQAGLHDAVDDGPVLAEDRYSLYSVDTGKIMEVDGGSTNDAASAVESNWSESPHEQFDAVVNSDGTYRLAAGHTGKVLTVANGGTDDAADVVQMPWSGTEEQRWYAVSLGTNRYCFINANSGRILDGEIPGDNVHQWHWEDDPNQKWDLVER
jgi:hypothetical protein